MTLTETKPTIDMPPELFVKIREYMAAGKHGKITLNIKAGEIVAWEFVELGRIDRSNAHL